MRTIHVIPWPARRGRARVLIEEPDAALVWAKASILRKAGYDAAICGGPDAAHDCPLVETGWCDLVDGADVAVSSLAVLDGPFIHRAIRAMRPDMALLVEAGDNEVAADGPIDGSTRLGLSMVIAQLPQAVERAFPPGTVCLGW